MLAALEHTSCRKAAATCNLFLLFGVHDRHGFAVCTTLWLAGYAMSVYLLKKLRDNL